MCMYIFVALEFYKELTYFYRIPKSDGNETLAKSMVGDAARAVSPGKAISAESLGKTHSSNSVQINIHP